MRDVTAIESAWLLELAPHFYQQGTVGMNRACPPKPPVILPLHIFQYAFILQFSAEIYAPPIVHRMKWPLPHPQNILGKSTIPFAYSEVHLNINPSNS